MSKEILIIVNPVSGRLLLKQKLWQVAYKFSEADMVPTIYFTKKKGDAEEMAMRCTDRFDTVVCAGGDGTLNEVINGLVKNPVPHTLGYIPVGTTNDLATSLNIPKSPIAAVNSIIKGNVCKIDVGKFGDRVFNYIASFGAFTEASYSTPQEVKNAIGHAAYVIEGIKSLSNIKATEATFSFEEGETVSGRFIFAAISNTTSVGGVLKLQENMVAFNDGLLEVLLIKEPSNLSELQKIISELLSQKFTGEFVSLHHTKKVVVKTLEPLDWTLDGEHQRSAEEIVIKNLREAVSLIVPAKKK